MEIHLMHVNTVNAGRSSVWRLRRNRVALSIAALVQLTVLIGSPAAQAQTMTWGVFQENVAPAAANYPGNCWSQAMVSGDRINGALLQGQLTQQQAQNFLETAIGQGTCMNQSNN
jgi:hypothetical protein